MNTNGIHPIQLQATSTVLNTVFKLTVFVLCIFMHIFAFNNAYDVLYDDAYSCVLSAVPMLMMIILPLLPETNVNVYLLIYRPTTKPLQNGVCNTNRQYQKRNQYQPIGWPKK